MEEESEKLRQLQSEVDKQLSVPTSPNASLNMSFEEKLEQHFHGCGSINRVTILCNKFDGHPKGFAYVE